LAQILVEIFTNGACSGNPGLGGWAAIIRQNGAEEELTGGDPATTNQRMELMPAIAALGSLTERCRVRLYSDSQYLIKGMSGGVDRGLEGVVDGEAPGSVSMPSRFSSGVYTRSGQSAQLRHHCISKGCLVSIIGRTALHPSGVDTPKSMWYQAVTEWGVAYSRDTKEGPLCRAALVTDLSVFG
jgi:ribonuclease HI